MCNLTTIFLFWQEDESFEHAASNMKEASPKIVVKGSIQNCKEMAIVAEMIPFTFQAGLAEAAVTFMATNYVFMFQYPGSLNNFCLFLQKCILSINDGKKLPASVISFVNKLDTMAEDPANCASDDSNC